MWIGIGALVLAAVPVVAVAPAGGSERQALGEHDVALATSGDGLSWSRADDVLIERASVPDAVVTPAGRLRVYYVDASEAPSTLECAELADGRLEVLGCEIAGQPTPLALDPSIVRWRGRYRLYYYSADEFGIGDSSPHEIRRAVSRDGVHFEDRGVAFTYPGLVDPDVFRAGRRWLMYVMSLSDRATVLAESKGGRRFGYVGPLSLQGWGTTAPVKLGRGRFRLYAFRQGEQRSFSSFTSTDARTWTQEPGTRLTAAAGEEITDPQVVRTDGGWTMVFKTSPSPGGR